MLNWNLVSSSRIGVRSEAFLMIVISFMITRSFPADRCGAFGCVSDVLRKSKKGSNSSRLSKRRARSHSTDSTLSATASNSHQPHLTHVNPFNRACRGGKGSGISVTHALGDQECFSWRSHWSINDSAPTALSIKVCGNMTYLHHPT